MSDTLGAELQPDGPQPQIGDETFFVWVAAELGLPILQVLDLARTKPEELAKMMDAAGLEPPTLEELQALGPELAEQLGEEIVGLPPEQGGGGGAPVPAPDQPGATVNPAPQPPIPQPAPSPAKPDFVPVVPPGVATGPSPSSPAGGARAASELQTFGQPMPAETAAAEAKQDAAAALIAGLEGIEAPAPPEVPTLNPPSFRQGAINAGGIERLLATLPGQAKLDDNRIRLATAVKG